MNEGAARKETMIVRIPRERWKKLKDIVNERQKAGDGKFTIGDAIEEAFQRLEKENPDTLDKFLVEETP